MTNEQLQAAGIAIITAVGTAVAALVPSWSEQSRIIVATLGTILTAVLPLVHVGHAKAAAIKDSPAPVVVKPVVAPAPQEPTPDVPALVQDAVSRVDFAAIARAQLSEAFAPKLQAVPPPEPPAA